MHNPNPFDFVPFAEKPILKRESEFDGMGELYSGYLDLRIKSLTPIHVVGYQKPEGNERTSYIYRQDGTACIPAATIRGCLRAFIEALTAGWVSQANTMYDKKFGGRPPRTIPGGRHIGFSTFDTHPGTGKNPAVDPAYQPKSMEGDDPELDVASYLFGIVMEKEKGQDTKHEALARKSRVWVEDAYISEQSLDEILFWLPDISGEAFMGGGKPSASNWWYMQAKEVWQRRIRSFEVAEFIGDEYWGRKFYYHQVPEKCVAYYEPENGNWPYVKNSFCKVNLECVKPGANSNIFRIYVDRLPHKLLLLLVLSLLPGKNIRHKLGYGKSYGYGSIRYEIESAMLRKEDHGGHIPKPLSEMKDKVLDWGSLAWDKERLKQEKIDDLIDWSALKRLAQILGTQGSSKLMFTYPPFPKGFLFSVSKNYQAEIEAGTFSAELRNEFQKRGIELQEAITIEPKYHDQTNRFLRWEITRGAGAGKITLEPDVEAINVYTYQGNFAQPLKFAAFRNKADGIVNVSQKTTVTLPQARKIAGELFGIKKPIHFRVYQEKATGWSIIQARKP